MLASMIPRGPDDSGQVEVRPRDGGSWLLGARRLAILDLSAAGHQPMRDPLNGNWLVYNGEIYNFRELRRQLQTHGCEFHSDCDTEVLLHGYRVWGEDVIPRLEGMFAFAVWDNAQQRLLLARDRHGIKPLYHYERGGAFLFASELRALLTSGLVPHELDATGLDSLMKFGAVQEPATLVRGVRLLPAGYLLRWSQGQARAAQYCNLFDHCAGAPHVPQRRAEFLGELRERLRQAIRWRLVSDVPLGVFLSGGLDSSVVAAIASASTDASPVRTFTITFPEKRFAEGHKARRVAQHLKTEHHEILISQESMLGALPDALAAMDQPTVDGINTYFVSRATKQGGVTVALSGLGGDELFAGYRSFRRVPQMETAERLLPGWLREMAGNALALLPRRRDRKSSTWLRGRYGYGHPFYLSRLLLTPAQVARLWRPEWLLKVDFRLYQPLMNDVARLLASADPVNRVSSLELATYLRNTLLRDSDCMSMANSLELRVPLLDHSLTEFVLRAPGAWKLDGKLHKPLLLAAAGELLPAEIARQPKRGFEFPWVQWMRSELREDVHKTLADPGEALQDVLDWRGVAELWNGFLHGTVHWSRPWLFYVLKKWMQRNFTASPSLPAVAHSASVGRFVPQA